ncbi:MAG TPA: DUF5329 domain-containing protein [Geothrix sp.]|jgi:hypothetical protein
MIPVLLFAAPAPVSEAQTIEALIQAVADLQGAVFLRNGSGHTPKEAAEHLRMKWKNAGRRVKTAQEFIQHFATGSSMSGQPYEIRFKDGRTVLARDWLWTELKRMQAKP